MVVVAMFKKSIRLEYLKFTLQSYNVNFKYAIILRKNFQIKEKSRVARRQSEEQIDVKHTHHAGDEGISGIFFVSVAVCFGNHLIADYIEHSAAGNSGDSGQECGREIADKEAYEDTHNLHHSDSEAHGDDFGVTNANHQQRSDDDHALGDILQCNRDGNRVGVADIGAVKNDAGSEPLGEFVNSNGNDKEQHAVDAFIELAVRLLVVIAVVDPGDVVEMRGDLVEHGDEEHAERHPDERLPTACGTSHLHGGYDEAYQRSGEHHSGAETEKNIVPAVRDFTHEQARGGAEQRGESQPTGTQ